MDQPIRRCRDLDERLTPYVDEEAAPDERRVVDAHLSKCPPCRDHAVAERTMCRLVANSDQPGDWQTLPIGRQPHDPKPGRQRSALTGR